MCSTLTLVFDWRACDRLGVSNMSDDETVFEFNKGHYFELLDRVHVASSYIQMALGEHPVLLKHPELQAFYDEAVKQLEDLYQALGNLEQTWE
jgi:ribosome-binding factor A